MATGVSGETLALGRYGTRTIRDRVLVGVLILGAWQVAHVASSNAGVPAPGQVVVRLARDLAGGVLAREAGYTVTEALVGLAIGAVPGILLPVIAYRRHVWTAIVGPYMDAAYGVPKLVFTPLFLLWFGIGMGGKVAVVASSTFFIVYVHCRLGVRAINPDLYRIARVLGTPRRAIPYAIVLPAAAPFVMTGLRLAIPYAFGGAVVAELMSSNRGLGYLLQFAVSGFDDEGVVAVMVLLAAIVAIANAMLKAIAARMRSVGTPSGDCRA